MKDFHELRESLNEGSGDFPSKFKKNEDSKQFQRWVAYNVLHRFKVEDPKDLDRAKEREIINWVMSDSQMKGLKSWDRDILGDAVNDVLFGIKKTGYKGLLRRGDM